MGTKLSVIIPVYNTMKTLDKTVESVLNQSLSDIQIIMVDDGSPDGAGDRCDELADIYDNIQVIHKCNQGLGLARNSGMELAAGEFIAFLDSDDWIEKDAYKECIEILESNNGDACYYGRRVYRRDGTFSVVNRLPDKLVFSNNEEIVRDFAPRYFGDWNTKAEENFIRESSCCAMYRRSIVTANNILFMSERECLSEDLFFNLLICRYAKGITIIPKNYYHQGFNSSSLTRRVDHGRFEKTLGMYRGLVEYTRMFPEITDALNRSRYRIIAGIRGIIRDEAAVHDGGIVEANRLIMEIVCDEKIQEIFSSYEMCHEDYKTSKFIQWVGNKQWMKLFLFYYIRGMLRR